VTATETRRAASPLMAAATSCWWPPLLTVVAGAAVVVVGAALDSYLSGGVDWWLVATLPATPGGVTGVRKCLLSARAAICLAALAAVMVVTVWRYVQSPPCLACDDPPPIAAPPTLNLAAVATGTATPVSWKGQS
jgi:hypothetical protein